jgi:hypothetical protein
MAAPDVDDVTAYLGETSYTPAELADVLAAEQVAQARRCRVPAVDADWPADLAQALKRRVARNLAMRGIPLAVLQGDADFGALSPPMQDIEIRRLESPLRRLPIG